MPNGMEHIDWGHEASGRVYNLRKELEVYRESEMKWREEVLRKILEIETRLEALEQEIL